MGGTIDKILGIGETGGADVRDGSMNRGVSTTLRDNTKSTQEYLNTVYGTILVGGNIVFITNSGKNNKNLWLVVNISEGECEGIKQRDDEEGTPVDQVFLDDKLYTELGSTVEYWFYSGTDSQTYNTDINAVFPEWNDNKRNTCYIVMKITYNGDLYQRTPKILIEMEGKRVWDFRDTTTKFSDNPVLVLYDFMTSDRYGVGLAASKIDETSWTSAANYCDTKGWTMNGAVTKRKAQDLIDSILQLFRGNLTWYDGKYFLKYKDMNYESVVMTLTDYHVMQSANGQMQIKIAAPSRFNKADGMRVKFKDPDQAYVEDDFMIGDTLGKIEELNLSLVCTDRDHAAQIGVYNLERLILNRQISGTFRDDVFQLDPGDLVNVTFDSIAVQGTMRVDELKLNTNGSVGLNLLYESPLLYDDDYNLILADVYQCTLPDPNAIPPSVTNIELDEEYYDYRGRSFTRLNIEFDVPDGALWSHAEIWRSFDDSKWDNLGTTTSDFSISNVLDGETYYIKIRSVSLYDVKESLDSCPKVIYGIQGVDDLPPPSLLYLSAITTQNNVNLYSDKLPYSDIEVYEFRLGSWAGGTFLGALRAPNLSLTGIKPGTYTFYANTKGTNGLYGEVPVFTTVTIPDPPQGWTLYDTFTYWYNLIENGHFEEGTSGWLSSLCTLADVAGGVSGNCLQITRTGGNSQYAYQSIEPRIIEEGVLEYTFWVKSGTAGDTAWEVGIWNATANDWISAGVPGTGNSTGSWVQYTFTGTVASYDLDDNLQIRLIKDNSSGGTMLFDEVVVTRWDSFYNCEPVVYNGTDYIKGLHQGQPKQSSDRVLTANSPAYFRHCQRWNPFRDLVGLLSYVRFWVKNVGGSTGDLVVGIYPDNGVAKPDYVAGPILESAGVDVTTIGSSYEWVTFTFDEAEAAAATFTKGISYYIVLAGDAVVESTPTDHVDVGSYGTSAWNSNALSYNSVTGVWTDQLWVLTFQADEFTGRWESRVIDIGVNDDYLAYALFDTVQVGGGNLWEDFSPLTNTWDDISALTQTWGELLLLDAAGQIYLTIWWGATYLTGMSKFADKQEFMSTIVDDAEYFKLEMTITDPSNDIYMHASEIEQKFLT